MALRANLAFAATLLDPATSSTVKPPTYASDELAILTKVVRWQLAEQAFCLITPMQAPPAKYRELLVGDPWYAAETEARKAYLEDVRPLVAGHADIPTEPRYIVAEQISETFPSARKASQSECPVVVTVVRPAIMKQRAYLAATYADRCRTLYYRLSFQRIGTDWKLASKDLVGGMLGPTGCATVSGNPTTGIKGAERIRVDQYDLMSPGPIKLEE